uniref:Uncharacterized protein n=1 Tax=Peronospora matthiolae TaxID=2874970 RepID=A0AAV1V7N2_9STRA
MGAAVLKALQSLLLRQRRSLTQHREVKDRPRLVVQYLNLVEHSH